MPTRFILCRLTGPPFTTPCMRGGQSPKRLWRVYSDFIFLKITSTHAGQFVYNELYR